MMSELDALETWAAPLLARLQPAQRTRLARAIGTALRRSQGQRIARQRNPDGSPYAPRRTRARVRDKAGRIRRARAMFAGLRKARHFIVRAGPDSVAVGFIGRTARIARVHQEGLVDAVAPGGPRVRYPRRVLLGFTDADRDRIRHLLIEHLGA